MATTTIRPNGQTVTGSWTAMFSGSIFAATSDNNDLSYANHPGFPSTGITLILSFDTFTLPPFANIVSVTPRIRQNRPSGGFNNSFGLRLGGVMGTETTITASSTIATHTGATSTTRPGGGAWTQADIDNIQIGYRTSNLDSNPHRVYEAYIDVVYNLAPVVDPWDQGVIHPDDPGMFISWTYTDAEGDAQERYQVKIFNEAQYTAGGFDPETSTPYFDSGVVVHSGPSYIYWGDRPLGPHRFYVKAGDVGSGGRMGEWAFGSFSGSNDGSASLTGSGDLTASPTTSAVAEASLSGVGSLMATPFTPICLFPYIAYVYGGAFLCVDNFGNFVTPIKSNVLNLCIVNC